MYSNLIEDMIVGFIGFSVIGIETNYESSFIGCFCNILILYFIMGLYMVL